MNGVLLAFDLVNRLPRILLLLLIVSATSNAAVLLTASPSSPIIDTGDQFNLGTDAAIPGGIFNSQAFSDNAGPPGQTFTTAAGFSFTLDAFSFKGAATGSGNIGGFTETTTWGLRLSEVSGTTLTPILTVTGIASPVGLVGDEWLTWTFTGTDQKTLLGATTYAVEVFSSQGYYGFDAAVDPNSYTGGFAFNNAGAARNFTSTTAQDRGYDRTFVANVSPVPEPSGAVLMLGGLALLAHRRRR